MREHDGVERVDWTIGGSYPSVYYNLTMNQDDDPTFLKERNDHFVDINAGYRFQYDENWSLSPTLRYNNNDSNIVTSDFDRFSFMVHNLPAVTAFGVVASVLFLIPVLGPVLMVPAASAGGLWMVCRLDKNFLRPEGQRIGPGEPVESGP